MPSLLCRSQISIGSEFGQYIPTVVHTVRELQLWTKEMEWRHPSTKGSYCVRVTKRDLNQGWCQEIQATVRGICRQLINVITTSSNQYLHTRIVRMTEQISHKNVDAWEWSFRNDLNPWLFLLDSSYCPNFLSLMLKICTVDSWWIAFSKVFKVRFYILIASLIILNS